jgi:hypothetical protein
MSRRFLSRTRQRAELLLFLSLTTLVACGAMWDHLLGPLHEGPHRIEPTTVGDIQRGQAVAVCLQSWARANGYASADYRDVDFTRLVIVRVGGDGVIGVYNGATFQVDAREAADTIFMNEGLPGSETIALERHEFVHIVQERHPELIGTSGDRIHWPPPFDACQVVLAVFSS